MSDTEHFNHDADDSLLTDEPTFELETPDTTAATWKIEQVAEVPAPVRGPGRPMRPEIAAMIETARLNTGAWLSRIIPNKTNSEAMASYGRTLRRHGCEVACRTTDGETRVFWRHP